MTETKKRTTTQTPAPTPEPIAVPETLNLDAILAANAAMQSQLTEMSKMNQQLIAALHASREAAKVPIASTPTGKKQFRVENISGMSLHFYVVNTATGRNTDVALLNNGDFVNLNEAALEELLERQPNLLANRLVTIPGFSPEDAEAIRDYDAYIAGIPLDEVNARIGAVENIGLLNCLYNHIETKRFKVVTGQNKAGEKEIRLDALPLDPKSMAILMAVADRLHALTGVRIQLN